MRTCLILSVNAEWHAGAGEQNDKTWKINGAHEHHEHKSTRSPFARKLLTPNDMDPDELADMLLVGLPKRFGDIPEVHTFLELRQKMFKNEPLTLNERIAYTTAQYHQISISILILPQRRD